MIETKRKLLRLDHFSRIQLPSGWVPSQTNKMAAADDFPDLELLSCSFDPDIISNLTIGPYTVFSWLPIQTFIA